MCSPAGRPRGPSKIEPGAVLGSKWQRGGAQERLRLPLYRQRARSKNGSCKWPPPCFTLFSFFFLLRFVFDFEPLFLSFSSLFPLFFLFFRLAFFGLNFGSIFGRFFVNFYTLEPLILSLPSRRNAIFYKIGVFAFTSKIDPKNVEIWNPKSMKNW